MGDAGLTVPVPHSAGFVRETEPFRRELLAHCYRMLGSVQDAGDALQESLLAAWRTAVRNNEIRKVVVSDSLTAADTASWTDTTAIVPRAKAADAVRDLKQEPGEDNLRNPEAARSGTPSSPKGWSTSSS